MFEWYINDEKLEIVESFIYLGLKLVKRGNWCMQLKQLSDQALRAMNNLLVLFKTIKLDTETKLLLFDRMLAPILLYSFELWEIYDYKEIDEIQFYKIVLGVKKQTSTNAVYGTLGCYPLSILCFERSMNFLFLIVNCETLVHTVFIEQVESTIETCWEKEF